MKYLKSLITFFFVASTLFAGKNVYTKVIQSDIESTVIEFEMDDFKLVPVQTDQGGMHLVKFNHGASFLKKGAPDIQKHSRSIIIPDDAEMQYDILYSKYTDYENIKIAPSKGNLTRRINPNEIAFEFGNEYYVDSFFPSSLINLQSPYILRDLRGLTVDFHPVQYNPITEVLRVYEKIQVKVYNTGESHSNILHRGSNLFPVTKEYQNIYENHFLNYTSDNRFDYLDDHGNMLIISYGAFTNEMQELVNWKNRKGIPTEMVNVSDIGSNSTAIKNYVVDYYNENGLTFLLLVGDVSQIPSINVSGSASDPSYGFIDGNDSYAEVIVGRFSGSNPNQIATQVQRSIEYERYPYNGGTWYSKAMGVASTQGPGYGGYTDAEFNDFLWNDVLSNFTYDSYQYSYDGSGSVSQGMEIINNGVSIINYTGHGGVSGWGNGAPLSSSNVNSLTNTNMLPFVISVACNVGEFDATDECFSEAWLRATNDGEPSGAIATMGSTISMSWEPPMHGQYGMNLILTESYEDHITRSIGGIGINGCLYMNDAQGSSGINETNYWTFFGDPSVEIRTDQPSLLNVSHDAAVVVGQSEINVNTGTDNSLVALSSNNELLAFAYSENGNALLDLSNVDLLPGDYDLVVTSFNAIPYETSISVITPEGPYVTLDSYVVVEDNNNNGMIEFDENISLAINANNVGVDNASNVTATITSTDAYLSNLNTSLTFGNIEPGSQATAGNINFLVAHNVPDGHNAEISINFETSDGFQWDSNLNITIHAPIFTVSNPSFSDAGGDGIWDAGEMIYLTVLLNNEGSADHYIYPGVVLSESSDEAEISEGMEFHWLYGIEAGSSVALDFPVTASEDANMGSEVTFTAYATEMNCGENCIDSEPITFTFTIGLPFSDDLYEPLNLSASVDESSINLNWDEPFQCPQGQISDCDGLCVDEWYLAWIGDGICDDGGWGVNFACSEYNNDGGDCGDIVTCEDNGQITCPDGSCAENSDECPEITCDPGYVLDCADEDCCPESWIGDGFADCEDQAYGCDLTCYDNDGGDCLGRGIEPTGEKNGLIYKNRMNADFSSFKHISSYSREVDGYFIYRDGSYISFTDQLNYSDTDINAGNEYCYHVTAVYEQGQSIPSNTACAVAEGEPGIAGDLNDDGMLNILDVISLINMVLGSSEVDMNSADLNDDGMLNILDIITLVNMVLSGRTISDDTVIGNNATIYEGSNAISISSDGMIAGIQISLNSRTFEINENLPIEVQYVSSGEQHIILFYGLNGETLSGNKVELLNVSEDYQINSIIVSNIISNPMEINKADAIPRTFTLNQNFPNPFNPSTNIDFILGQEELISLNIYDINGRFVHSLTENTLFPSGHHNIVWNGKNSSGSQVPSGIYFYKLTGNTQTITKKMVLMK